jgi:hypothetical protein
MLKLVDDILFAQKMNEVNANLQSVAANIRNNLNSLQVFMDTDTYKISFVVKNGAGETLSSQMIDLPLESVVVNGSYSTANRTVTLSLQNGNTVSFSLGDLVNDLYVYDGQITINGHPLSDHTIVVSMSDIDGLTSSLNAKINATDIVNDLTTGGTTKVLSAEQGKELAKHSMFFYGNDGYLYCKDENEM